MIVSKTYSSLSLNEVLKFDTANARFQIIVIGSATLHILDASGNILARLYGDNESWSCIDNGIIQVKSLSSGSSFVAVWVYNI